MASSRLAVVYRQVDSLFRDGTVTGLSDRELIERFRERGERSELAFAGLVERHGPMVLGVCRSVLRDPNDIDDAFQATFLVLVRRAGSLWVRDSIGPWLYNVAGRVALRARRDSDRRRAHEERAGGRATDASLGGERSHERAEAARLLHEELTQLPERWRGPLVLCHLEGLTHEQASRSLGVPVGTIRSRLSRGRERLKDRLIRRGLAPSLAAATASGLGLTGEGSAAILPASLLHKTVSAGIALASGWATAGAISVTTFQLTKGVLMSMFLANAKTAAMVFLVAGGTLAASMNAAGTGPAKPASASVAVTTTEDPKPTNPPREVSETVPSKPATSQPRFNPKPIQTTVRITVLEDDRTAAFGSGTIISSTPQESIILTAGQLFTTVRRTDTKPSEFPYRVKVELIESLPFKTKSGAGRFELNEFTGKVIDYDWNRDLGLIRIQPGHALPFSPIIPPSWKAAKGMQMFACGYPDSTSPTYLVTKILGPLRGGLVGRPNYEGTECNKAPREGMFGGGLFTHDRYLAGVCNFDAPETSNGVYASPSSIYAFLDRNGLKRLYAAKSDEARKKETPATGPIVRDSHAETTPEPAEIQDIPKEEPAYLPPKAPAARPKPWETVVRIRIPGPEDIAFASGTVISSTPEESIVLTVGRVFKLNETPQPKPASFPRKILVDLFDGHLQGSNPVKAGKFVETISGEVIDFDLKNELGLIRIRPGRKLHASPVVPSHWNPEKRMHMLTVGCSEGRDPTVWTTNVETPQLSGLFGEHGYNAIECTGAPMQGRSGGGLFTDDNYLAGVCVAAESKGNHGYYIHPATIYAFLDRNKLEDLYAPTSGIEAPKAEPASAPAANEATRETPPANTPAKPQSTPDLAPAPPQIHPPLPGHPDPPIESTVRITIRNTPNSVIHGSGTIIFSTAEESFILTTRRLFKTVGIEVPIEGSPRLADFKGDIQIETFYWSMSENSKERIAVTKLPGTLIAVDAITDLALVRIHPGRRLIASPIVPSGWNPVKRMKLYAVACSREKVPHVMATQVFSPRIRGLFGQDGFDIIEVSKSEGQRDGFLGDGDGLFAENGKLIGVGVDAPMLSNNRSYFIHPATIHAFLNHNGLKKLCVPTSGIETPKAEPASAPAANEATRGTPPTTKEPVKPQLTAAPVPPFTAESDLRVQSTVQISVRNARDHVTSGSGTVISSTAEESIVLTAGHLFKSVEKDVEIAGVPLKDDGSPSQARNTSLAPEMQGSPKPADFEGKIRVALFAWTSGVDDPSQFEVTATPPGTLIDVDPVRDVALVRIRPGRVLPVSPIVPPTWKTLEGMNVMAVGWPETYLPSAERTTVIDPLRSLGGNHDYEGIECRLVPVQKSIGGGLFTNDGHLVGVSNFVDEVKGSCVYAAPGSIYRILLRNGLNELLPPSSEAEKTLVDAVAKAERRLVTKGVDPENSKRLQGLLDRIYSREKEIDFEKQRVQQMAHRVARLILEEEDRAKAKSSNPTSIKSSATPKPPEPPVPAGVDQQNAASDTESRLKEVEQKLDRVLKLLEKSVTESSDRKS